MSETRIHVTQGHFATGSESGLVITTLLGSCVSVCLWDEQIGLGGLNHMLLARPSSGNQARTLSGMRAMEVLINDLLKQGAVRSRLKAKAFGGARMIEGLSDIGQQNAEFAEYFLAREGIPLVTKSFGGTQARNLRFWPATGRALQKVTQTRANLVEVEPPTATVQGLELF